MLGWNGQERRLSRLTYVEDEPDIREIAQIALQVLGGFELELCVDGYDAVSRVPILGTQMVLLDVMMPGLDGMETFRRLRADERTADLPIVFMTARVHDDELDEYARMGCAGIIAKPFDPVHLPHRVREIWASRTLQ